MITRLVVVKYGFTCWFYLFFKSGTDGCVAHNRVGSALGVTLSQYHSLQMIQRWFFLVF